MDAFDADVLIYAASAGHPLGKPVLALFTERAEDDVVGLGSVLLLPEVIARPMRQQKTDEVDALLGLLARLQLLPVDAATAELATGLAAAYGLRTADAVHLATAVGAGADRFVTNNRRDFGPGISEIEVVSPGGL